MDKYPQFSWVGTKEWKCWVLPQYHKKCSEAHAASFPFYREVQWCLRKVSDLSRMYTGKVNSLLTSFFTKMYFSPIKSTNQKRKKKDWNESSILRIQQHTLHFWVMQWWSSLPTLLTTIIWCPTVHRMGMDSLFCVQNLWGGKSNIWYSKGNFLESKELFLLSCDILFNSGVGKLQPGSQICQLLDL